MKHSILIFTTAALIASSQGSAQYFGSVGNGILSQDNLAQFTSQTLSNVAIPAPTGLNYVGQPLIGYHEHSADGQFINGAHMVNNFVSSSNAQQAGFPQQGAAQGFSNPYGGAATSNGFAINSFAANGLAGGGYKSTPGQCMTGCMDMAGQGAEVSKQCGNACGGLIRAFGQSASTIDIDWQTAGRNAGIAVQSTLTERFN